MKAASRKLHLKDCEYNIPDFYKRIKEKGEDMGFLVIEKEQTNKFTKYGQETKFEFILSRDYDELTRATITVSAQFMHVNKVKGIDKGEVTIDITGKYFIDFKNRFENNAFNRFLFKIYLKIKKKEFFVKYLLRTAGEVGQIYNYLKDNLQVYHV